MRVAIEAKDRKEAEAIRHALADTEVRAFVVVVGTLMQLDSDRARQRVMTFVADTLAEAREREVTR